MSAPIASWSRIHRAYVRLDGLTIRRMPEDDALEFGFDGERRLNEVETLAVVNHLRARRPDPRDAHAPPLEDLTPASRPGFLRWPDSQKWNMAGVAYALDRLIPLTLLRSS